MKDLLNFLNKPEADEQDLALIVTVCIGIAIIAILILMATGN